MTAMFEPLKKAGKFFHETFIAPNLRLYGNMIEACLDFCNETVPSHVARKTQQLERAGAKYCHGRLAKNRMPLGIVMRDAARAASLPRETVTGALAINAAAFLLPAGIAMALLLPQVSLLACLIPCMAAGVVASPFARAYLCVAAPLALGICGGLLAVPRALCNIGTGRAVTREYIAEKERARQPRALYAWEVDSLPRLQRIFHYELNKIAEAPAHERVQWLEALKHKFPDDFAKAAVLGHEELGTHLKHEMQVKKKPLRVKKPKRGLTQKIGGVFGRA